MSLLGLVMSPSVAVILATKVLALLPSIKVPISKSTCIDGASSFSSSISIVILSWSLFLGGLPLSEAVTLNNSSVNVSASNGVRTDMTPVVGLMSTSPVTSENGPD